MENKYLKKGNLLATTLVSSLLAVSSTEAAISIVNTATGVGDSSTSAQTITYALGAGNALAIGFYTDSGSHEIDSISFGGVAADVLNNGDETQSRTRMAYWLNPTGNDFSITFTNGSNEFGYILYELSGVNTSVAPIIDTSLQDGADPNTSITTIADSSFLIEWYGSNDDGIPSIASGPLGDVVAVDLTGDNTDGDTGTITSAHAASVGPGTYVTEWNRIGSNLNDGSVVVAFAAVPEPSSFALIGAGFAFMLTTRRR
ncbi:PEP-CTERM sorting domain-containing protein [Verrucomicrobiaceae bacterium 5K15]|uniref:PEP-CTERM sorting domain-containing protein n=1 Tax=Oceaniferula flava TaxID=2800421 RepID=A0AAE2SEN8_9BACT|nr:PEP-CTERM sorting domain-containing protein [Oceaniferula flavus]MBK1855602.1 PEP-CTERM sorting domain-containing protein [Oceaniferula flavus]MBM1136908.1 PEP-CTERM sorting domain-containing protein [Oceaniferula flavus]